MSNETAKTVTTNIVPVQGTFEPLPPYECINLIGPAGTPFYAPVNPNLDGVSITNSTINSTTIGQTTPAAAQFTTATQQNQPVGNNDLTTKLYVDSLALGISWKQPVLAATTADITLSGAQTIDSVSVVAGDRVLVKNQTAQAENGIYVAAAGAWSRSPDADNWDELVSALVFVESGGLAGSAWYCPVQQGGTLGTTAVTWNNFSVGGVYFAGTGLTLSGGDTFNISNTTVTAASYGSASAVPTFTVNAQGQLTAAADANIAIAATQITSGTIDSARLSGAYSGITGVGTLTDLTVSNVITGSISGNAATATTATNLAAGATGSIPYQSAAGTTTFLAAGSNGQVLTLAGGVPTYATPTTGTVTSVSGTGTVSGISLSGTVTSTGDLTLGGALDLSSPPVIGGTAPNSATFTTVNATTFDTNVAAAGLTLSGTSLAADGTDANITIQITPKGSGGVGIGGDTSGVVAGVPVTSKFCVKNDGDAPLAGFVHANNTTAGSGSGTFACRSRGTLASPTVVQSGDALWNMYVAGHDGTDLALAAVISVEVDGTPGNNDMPGRMVFSTTPDGSQIPTEAMRIDSTQTVTIPKASMTNATVSADLNLTGTLSVNGSSGTSGYVLTSNGASDPTWEPNANGVAIVDDTTTDATRYLTFTSATTGNVTTENVSSTKLQFNPSTGTLASSVVATNTISEGTSGSGVTIDGVFLKDSVAAATNFNATGTGANIMPVGSTAQRPASPAAGMYRLNTTTGKPEWYDAVGGFWVAFNDAPVYLVEYVVVAGGGGAGFIAAGGGGGGGYRSSVSGEASGGGASAESPIAVLPATNYTVTVGAGGAASASTAAKGSNGSNSVFSTVTSTGGGGGGSNSTSAGNSGGSGGGARAGGTAGTGTSGQGYAGGTATGDAGGAGGGAGGVGGNSNDSTPSAGAGGVGVTSSITGTSVGRAGGGGGCTTTGANGTATDGGGAGGSTVSNTGTSGTANTGGGGGGARSQAGGSGGSGVVILRYPSVLTISNPGGGLTFTTATVGGNKVTTFTAGTGTIQFN